MLYPEPGGGGGGVAFLDSQMWSEVAFLLGFA